MCVRTQDGLCGRRLFPRVIRGWASALGVPPVAPTLFPRPGPPSFPHWAPASVLKARTWMCVVEEEHVDSSLSED